MMNIFPPSGPVRVGDIANVPFYCSEPGTVDFTSSDPTVATVASTLLVPGTRVWRNGLKHGQYLARANCLQSRDPAAFFVEIEAEDFARMSNTFTDAGLTNIPIAINFRTDVNRRINWQLTVNCGRDTNNTYFRQTYTQSRSNASDDARTASTGKIQNTANATIRLIWMLVGTNVYFYYSDGTTHDYLGPRFSILSDMGSNEVFAIQHTCKLAKYNADMTGAGFQAARQAFFSDGTFPASPAALYAGGHEINPAAPVFYDTSGNGLDLSDVDVQYWPEAAASGDTTDTDLVEPYQAIAVNALKTGTTIITARRRRQGIPYRTPALPDAEVYEETTYVLTVTDALLSEQSTVQLMIYADRDGTATITMDNPIIAFPASAIVVLGKNQISGVVTGAGTCNVTVEMNGVSDVTTFVIEAIGTWIKAGPAQDYQVYLP